MCPDQPTPPPDSQPASQPVQGGPPWLHKVSSGGGGDGWRRGGPPWARGGGWGEWPPPHDRRRRGRLFLRFAGIFGLLSLVLLLGLGLLIYFVVRLAGGDSQTAALLWLGTCGLLLAIPLLVGYLGRRAFRSIAAPLADLLDASERVGAGDLAVRVPLRSRGEFVPLSSAFNHMVEELELADQRRRNLTADVAHELRTPLQIIQGNLEGLVDGVYQPTPEHLEATLAETRQLARLIEDLRVLSQAEAGQLAMQWETIELRDLLADVATSFSGQAQAAGVALAVEGGGTGTAGSRAGSAAGSAARTLDEGTGVRGGLPVLRVRGDYGRLEQVLGNLLGNALRHTGAGGSIAVKSWAHECSVRIEVADNGEGIAAEELPFVFDRFWRGDRARTHGAGGGSGLGLAIARQLVQAHGGTIAVQSTPGVGATFIIDLPSEA